VAGRDPTSALRWGNEFHVSGHKGMMSTNPLQIGATHALDMDERGPLFHRLNNQLGIILAHAELLEVKIPDAENRARAAQVVASVLDAMVTAREIRLCTDPPSDPS